MNQFPVPTLTQIRGPGARPLNETTWMLNIGTHVLPGNNHEYQILAESLRTAVNRVFAKPDFFSRLFYLTTGSTRNGTLSRFKDPIFRQATNLQIRTCNSTMVVERGTKTGRIDAHILVYVAHEETHIELDHNGFADMLQEELMTENQRFQGEQLYSQRVGKLTEILHWPELNKNKTKRARPYVSWRKIGRMPMGPAYAYMTKQFDRPPEGNEVAIFDGLKTALEMGNIPFNHQPPTHVQSSVFV